MATLSFNDMISLDHCFGSLRYLSQVWSGSSKSLRDKVGNKSGPAGLVRSAASAAIVAVEVLVEKDVILKVRIGLKFFIGSEDRTSPVGTTEKELYKAATQLIGDLVESHHHA